MQSVKTPLLVEESLSSLSSLVIVADDNRTVDVPDNRRHIHQVNSSFSSSNKHTSAVANNKKQHSSKSSLLSSPSTTTTATATITTTTTSSSAMVNDDDDDDENGDDGDPLLREGDVNITTTTSAALRKLPSTLFSPMSESGESSLVGGGSASGSALATPMEISR